MFDLGIMLYSTDYSYQEAEHMLGVGIEHAARLKNMAKDTYVVTIDSKDYSKKISAIHIPLRIITSKKYLKHLSFLVMSFRKISGILKENKGKRILLVARTFMAGMVISLLSKVYRVPSVVYCTYDWVAWKKVEGNFLNYMAARLAERISLKYSSLILVTTPTLKKRMIERGYDPIRVHIVPNHVDTERFRPMDKIATRKKIGMDEKEKSILFAGRFVPQKNLFVLLEAVKQLEEVKLYMAGEGDQEEELKEFASRHGIRNRVVFLGRISQDTLVEYMNACDVFVLPSLYEGHPKVLIEAMVCGCAVIASDVEGNNDVVVNRENGLLFDAASSSELAEKISMLLQDKRLAETLAEGALKTSKKYDLKAIIEKEKRIVDDLIHSSGL